MKVFTSSALSAFFFILAISSNHEGRHPTFRGTTVAYLRSPTEIAVAADSKAIALEDPLSVSLFCKIRQIEDTNLFIAIAGLAPCCEPDSDYVADIAQIYRQQRTIKATANAFMEKIIPRLESKLERLRNDPKVNYSRDLAGKRALEILFFGFEEEVPVINQWEYVASALPNGRIQYQFWECPGQLCPNGMAVKIMGHSDSVIASLSSRSDYFNPVLNGLPVVAERIVQQEIDFFADKIPQNVGPPIAVIQINKYGPRWIKPGSQCEEIRPQ